MQKKRVQRASGERGVALVSALLIVILITSLALIAEITSQTEIRVVTNVDQSKKMFFLAEQTLDRILMHLHDDPRGAMRELKVDPAQTIAGGAYRKTDSESGLEVLEIGPRRVMYDEEDKVHPMIMRQASTNWVSVDSDYEIEAAIDPKNFVEITECSDFNGCTSSNPDCGYEQCNFARPYSNPFRVLVRVTNKQGGFTKVFAAEIKPKSAFDFAYFAQDMAHDLRSGSDAPSFCQAPNYPNYNCNTVFRNRSYAWVACGSPGSCNAPEDVIATEGSSETGEFRSRHMIGDQILGDVYVGGDEGNWGRFFVRGKPLFLGEIWWQYSYPYQETLAHRTNQTAAGSDVSDSHHPLVAGGIRTHADTIRLFPDNYNDSFWAKDPSTNNVHGFIKQMADYQINRGGTSTGYNAVRILFRHDFDANHNGVREEPQLKRDWDGDGDEEYRPGGAVASAITPMLNNGVVDEDPNERGWLSFTMIPAWLPNWYLYNKPWERAILQGGTVAERMEKMDAEIGTNYASCTGGGSGDHPKEGFSTGVLPMCGVSTGNVLNIRHYERFNPGAYPSDNPGEPSWIEYYTVPSMVGDEFKSEGGTDENAGIIWARTNAYVSGVVDGTVSLFVDGDVVLDHEIEYEKDPLRFPHDVGPDSDQDMLAIFAKGDVVVPNSYPDKWAHNAKEVYLDDWSDAYQAVNMFGPKRVTSWDPYQGEGIFSPQGHFDTNPVMDDDGSEDVHALIAAWAYPCPGGTQTCSYDPANLTAEEKDDIIYQRVGFYARGRTIGTTPEGEAFWSYYGGLAHRFFLPMGNQSGPLRVVGSVAQRISGRVGYDYYNSDGPPDLRDPERIANCRKGYSEYDYEYPIFHHEDDRTCKEIGHEAFEITHDPRLTLTGPPTTWMNWNRESAWGFAQESRMYFAYHVFGNAAYQVVGWQELDASFNIAMDAY